MIAPESAPTQAATTLPLSEQTASAEIGQPLPTQETTTPEQALVQEEAASEPMPAPEVQAQQPVLTQEGVSPQPVSIQETAAPLSGSAQDVAATLGSETPKALEASTAESSEPVVTLEVPPASALETEAERVESDKAVAGKDDTVVAPGFSSTPEVEMSLTISPNATESEKSSTISVNAPENENMLSITPNSQSETASPDSDSSVEKNIATTESSIAEPTSVAAVQAVSTPEPSVDEKAFVQLEPAPEVEPTLKPEPVPELKPEPQIESTIEPSTEPKVKEEPISSTTTTVDSVFESAPESEDELEALAAVELEASRKAADPLMEKARNRMAWAEVNTIDKTSPIEYQSAKSAMEAAEIAYANERYSAAAVLATEVTSTISEDLIVETIAMAPEAEIPFVKLPSPEAPETEKPTSTNTALETEANLQAALPAEPEPESQAASVPDLVVEPVQGAIPSSVMPSAQTQDVPIPEQLPTPIAPEASVSISSLLNAAEASYEKAIARNAEHNYPELLALGEQKLKEARAANAIGDYQTTAQKAGAAYESLSAIPEFAPLPARYVVRKLPSPGDYLWKIAGYAFVYHNPEAWTLLYAANKGTFRFPSKPTHLYPGQVLEIPSIKGEKREGTWDPDKTYKPLDK